MPKRDSDLFDRLRNAGLRKPVAKALSETSADATKKLQRAARRAAAELRVVADEIEKRLPAEPELNPATATQTAAAKKPTTPRRTTTARKPATAAKTTTARKPATAAKPATARKPATAARTPAKPRTTTRSTARRTPPSA